MSEKLERIKHYCSSCNSHTNHSIINTYNKVFNEEYYHTENIYQIIECCGCERTSFKLTYYDFENGEQDDDGSWYPYKSVSSYPASLKNYTDLQYSQFLPVPILTVYDEAIKAFKSNCLLLTGVAFRAVIEAICIDNEVSGRNLEVKINNLVNKKLISEKEANRLHSVRFLGNDAVHEMSVPKEEQLYSVLEIIQHLLKNIYLIDHKAINLETIVSDLPAFIDLLNQNLKKLNTTDELSLRHILGKGFRRVNNSQLLETQLKQEIVDGRYNLLSIGEFKICPVYKQNLQHYIINLDNVIAYFKSNMFIF